LSPYGDLVSDAIEANDGVYDWRPATCEVSDWPDSDWVVSFGYRKIIPHSTIERFQGQIINIHGACLPWNKGADPNFWSWFDDTSKGVTIHRVADAIDGGEILAQEVTNTFNFRTEVPTLRTSYDDLLVAACGLFAHAWPKILSGQTTFTPYDNSKGSYHRASDKEKFMRYLTAGWNTSVYEVMDLGRIYRGKHD